MEAWRDREYVVYAEPDGTGQRLTFGGMHARAARIAGVMYTRYGVRKGDKGILVSRSS